MIRIYTVEVKCRPFTVVVMDGVVTSAEGQVAKWAVGKHEDLLWKWLNKEFPQRWSKKVLENAGS